MPFHEPYGSNSTKWLPAGSVGGTGSGHDDGAKEEPKVIVYGPDDKPAVTEAPPVVGFRP